MATLDEILGGSSPGSGGHAPKGAKAWHEQQQEASPTSPQAKGTQEWTEQHSGGNAPVSSPPAAPPALAKQKGAQPTGGEIPVNHGKVVREFGDGVHAFMEDGTIRTSGFAGYTYSTPENMSNVDLFKVLNPYTPPTAEELEKEKKKQKRNQIFAAIGDGISALSNLFFTTQYAPNMYTGKDTMSERTKIRYDKLMKDIYEKNMAYFNGLFRAKQADAEAAYRERAWKKDEDRYNEGIRHRNEREKITDDRYDAEQEYKKGRDVEADRRWQANFDENKRQADRSYNFQVKRHNDDVAVERDKARATAARGVRGKQLGFSDGDGNQVAIYENVWKGSMQQVFDAMIADGVEKGDLSDTRYKTKINKMSARDKDDFVKQNWHKSPKASAIMLSLSKLDPATMTSELNDEVVDYVPSGGDDDVIDYTPGKNK